MKTSKQNRTRQTRHRASDRGEFCRTSAKIELTPNAASTFHSSCPHTALHSLSLEPNIALCVAIEPRVRQRTCCVRAQTNSSRFVRLVCFGYQFVSNSVRCANLFAESDCGVECEQVSFAHWVLYRLITQLCCARAEWWREREGDEDRGLQFRGYILEIYCFIWLSSPTGSSTRVEFYTILQCWRRRRRSAAFITPDNKVELRLPVCAGCLMSVWNLVTLMRERESSCMADVY